MSLNITCSDLLTAKIKMDAVWADAAANVDYVAYVDALKVIQANQRGATFPDLTDPAKDRTVKVMWLNDCATGEVTDCPDECTIGGAEITDNCKDYTITLCKAIEFKVPEKRFRTSNWTKEEVIAKAMLTKMKQLDEYITQAVVAKLDVFAMQATNQFLGNFTASGGNTVIPAAYWNPNLMGYFVQASIKNKMRDAYLLSGNNLFQTEWQANNTGGNNDMADAVKKMTTFQKYFDLFNIDGVVGAQKSYLIRPSSVAFVSKNYYGSAPETIVGKAAITRYSVASKNLPFITYDVLHDTECVNSEIFYKWRLSFKGDLFVNPANCNGQINGLLPFICG